MRRDLSKNESPETCCFLANCRVMGSYTVTLLSMYPHNTPSQLLTQCTTCHFSSTKSLDSVIYSEKILMKNILEAHYLRQHSEILFNTNPQTLDVSANLFLRSVAKKKTNKSKEGWRNRLHKLGLVFGCDRMYKNLT